MIIEKVDIVKSNRRLSKRDIFAISKITQGKTKRIELLAVGEQVFNDAKESINNLFGKQK